MLWADNVETLSRALSSSSVIWYSIKNLRASCREYSEAAKAPGLSHSQFIRLRSRNEMNAFVADLTH